MIIEIEREDLELYSFILGTIFGSFLNVLIYRLPKKISIITPRSSCPHCFKVIPWYFNIPIISYIFLKAKCTYCGEKISFSYPLVELLSGILSLALFIKLGFTLEYLSMSLFIYLLITLSFIDFKYKAVPDYLLLIVFISSFFATTYPLIEAFKNAFLFAGAFVLLNFILTFYIQNIKSKLIKDESLKQQEALGDGDIPIVATIGVVLGIKSGLIAVFLAAFFAIIPSLYLSIVKKDIQTPFIPYLTLGIFVEYFFTLKVFD